MSGKSTLRHGCALHTFCSTGKAKRHETYSGSSGTRFVVGSSITDAVFIVRVGHLALRGEVLVMTLPKGSDIRRVSREERNRRIQAAWNSGMFTKSEIGRICGMDYDSVRWALGFYCPSEKRKYDYGIAA